MVLIFILQQEPYPMPPTAPIYHQRLHSQHLRFRRVYNHRRTFTHTALLFFKDVWMNNEEKTLKSLFLGPLFIGICPQDCTEMKD